MACLDLQLVLFLQVVVIGSGGNDFRVTPPPMAVWVADVIEFMNMVGAPSLCLHLHLYAAIPVACLAALHVLL